MRTCEWCGISIVSRNAQARFCTPKHRIYAHRANPGIPHELTSRNRWVRWDLVNRKGRQEKVPKQISGQNASSTNPNTWASYAAAKNSTTGVGLGYVLGERIGCIDLDHCLIDGQPTAATLEFLSNYPQHYIEISPSGDGLHIWGYRDEKPGRKETINGLSIETYSTGRYITITGNIYQHGQLHAL